MSTILRGRELAAQIEPFDSFWEGPEDIEAGYSKFDKFYSDNYLQYCPDDKDSKILVISCGPGYFVEMLRKNGYSNVLGIDSFAEKVSFAKERGLNCQQERGFEHLEQNKNAYDMIFCEQEVNHLTKHEIIEFLDLCYASLRSGGRLVSHALNGANPITGAEALAQNFDHYNSFTEYTFRQVLEYRGFSDVDVFGLNLYVFYKNPLNYILIIMSKFYSLFFTVSFIMYGKKNRLWTKKIGSIGRKK